MTLADPAVKEPKFIRLIKYSAGAPGEAPVLRETWLLAASGPWNTSQGYGSTRKLSTQAPVPFPHLFTGHPLLPPSHPALPMMRAWWGTKASKPCSACNKWTQRRDWSRKTNRCLRVCPVCTVYTPILPLFASIRLHSVSYKAWITLL